METGSGTNVVYFGDEAKETNEVKDVEDVDDQGLSTGLRIG
jgi:hypothetical protein